MLEQKAVKRVFSAILCAILLFISVPTYAVDEPIINAAAGIIIDYNTGEVLFEKDAHTARVPASMTKVMTTYIIFEELEAGNLTLETQVPISDAVANLSRNGSFIASVPLPWGGSVDVDTMIKLIMLPSASASCVAMAEFISGSEEAFAVRMNETAQRLGLNASYTNSHGVYPNYISAHSQAMLTREFITRFPQILNYTSLRSVNLNGVNYNNTNRLYSGYYVEGVDGFKTGTTAEAGYCVSSTAVQDGRRVITVVMGASSDHNRYNDTRNLLNYAFEIIKDISPVSKDIGTHAARAYIEILDDIGTDLTVADNYFRPDDLITSAEFDAMLKTALNAKGVAYNSSDFDKQQSTVSFETAISLVNENINKSQKWDLDTLGKTLTYGISSNSNPMGDTSMTRAQAAIFTVNSVDANIIINQTKFDLLASFDPIQSHVPYSYSVYKTPEKGAETLFENGTESIEIIKEIYSGCWYVSTSKGTGFIRALSNLYFIPETTDIFHYNIDDYAIGQIAPQWVDVIERDGDMIRILTWTGEKWFNINFGL